MKVPRTAMRKSSVLSEKETTRPKTNNQGVLAVGGNTKDLFVVLETLSAGAASGRGT